MSAMNLVVGVLDPGVVFKAQDGTKWIVLEQVDGGVKALMKSGLTQSVWRERNDDYAAPIIAHGYNGSVVDIVCEKHREAFENTGVYKFCLNEASLVTLDGRTAYGTTQSPLRLLTLKEAQSYMDILDKHRLGTKWWLATSRTVRSAVECYESTIMCIDDDDSHASIDIRKCTESLVVRPCAVFPNTMIVEFDEEASKFTIL